jgi:hypothetical protein
VRFLLAFLVEKNANWLLVGYLSVIVSKAGFMLKPVIVDVTFDMA